MVIIFFKPPVKLFGKTPLYKLTKFTAHKQ